MQALQVTRNGRPSDVLAVVDVDVPEPGPGEVRIRVSAASLNFNDIDRCWGRLVSVPTPPPYTLGMDACGVVDAAGAGCEHWIGKRVVAIAKMALGGIADYALAEGVSVFDAPPGFDDAEAAAFLLPYQTSHLALFRRGRLTAGQTLVVHSAASGLGTAGIQLGKAAGARVVAVAGGPEKAARCASVGADVVIDHTAEDFVEAVLAATGDAGADVIYDLAGGEFAERSWRCTAHGGRYLAVGFADDASNGMTGRPLRMACIGNIDIVGVMLAWVSAVDPGMRRFGFNPFGRDVADEIHADLLRLAEAGQIRPVIGQRVSIDAAGKALDEHEARRSVGRTVVIIAPAGDVPGPVAP
ncbi:MAG TPA: zinc-binding dehydrogenase [Streptosporangiaceae bacterium]|nr:zinc-binding dehydrogenase [Streptosporangiaceae bacterium]